MSLTGNIAVGYLALSTAASASNSNVALGNAAGRSITTGSHHIAIGYGALGSTSTLTSTGAGFGNIAIGNLALATAGTISASNVAIGNSAGQNITTGTGNILIGNFNNPSTSTVSNEIIISTNGTSATPVVGKGTNTAFIDARSGLYSFMPAYGFFASTNNTSNSMYWNNTILAKNITVSDKTVTLALAGIYDVSITGSINAAGTSVMSATLILNSSQYPSVGTWLLRFSNAGTGGNMLGISCDILMSVGVNSTFYINTEGMSGRTDLPIYLTIKYISAV